MFSSSQALRLTRLVWGSVVSNTNSEFVCDAGTLKSGRNSRDIECLVGLLAQFDRELLLSTALRGR